MRSFLVQAVREMGRAARALSARAASFLRKVVEPVGIGEDVQRKEYILNVILVLSISCLIVLWMTVVWNRIELRETYAGIDPVIFCCIIAFYLCLLVMSKKGHGSSASLLLMLSDAVGTIYTGWEWGASLPATLLLTVLTIVVASVLIGSTVGFIAAGCMISILTLLGIHEATFLNVPDWRYDEITATDVVSYSAMLVFISFIGWLSNRQIDASLKRARRSERQVEVERDHLERRISERTEELVASQRSIVAKLEHSAQIGDLSRGVLHDLMSPLSAIALCMEDMTIGKRADSSDIRYIQSMIQEAASASGRMSSFMDSVRRHISPDGSHVERDVSEITDLQKELDIIRDILAYKARMTRVHIAYGRCGDIRIDASPVRIHQTLLNLVSNAIDACMTGSEHRRVQISAEKAEGAGGAECAQIIVSDTGCGMSKEHLMSVMESPSSTKIKGTGVGLMTVRSIVERELGGWIDATSQEGFGTTFTITIPLKRHGTTLGKSAAAHPSK